MKDEDRIYISPVGVPDQRRAEQNIIHATGSK